MKLKHLALTLATLAALSFGSAHAAVTVTSSSNSSLLSAAAADASAKGDGVERCDRKKTEHGKRDCICKFEPNNPICKPSKS